MSLDGVLKAATSPRTTVLLLCVMAVLLFLNVALPQERVLGEEAFAAICEDSRAAGFVLDTLGLGRMSVSPVFLGFLALFFLHLTLVLAKRAGVTIRRTRLRPPSRQTLEGWATGERALTGTATCGLDRNHILKILKGFGYRVVGVGDDAVWSVKHRTAPLGFLIFHLSFFLICLGGAAIYYTRSVGTAVLVEGQEFTGVTKVIRAAPWGAPPDVRFIVEEVVAEFEAGEPVHLSAKLRFFGPGGGIERTSRINHPARLGTVKVLVNRVGLAPTLWLQDLAGFTIDRVAVAAATLTGPPTVVPMANGRITVELRPLVDSSNFPDRDRLLRTDFAMRILRDEEVLFDGPLSTGGHAEFDGAVLAIPEVGYWVGVYVVSERGGGLLVLGFVLGTLGLVWRLMLFRREVAVVWRGQTFAVVGRAEYFSHRFRQELETLRGFLVG